MTVTDIGALKVELWVLAKYARERHEDAYTAQAVTNFIATVAAIPEWAWGTYEPWSKTWAAEWRTLAANRQQDASTLRDQFGNMASGLYQVAADYQNADIDIALDFEPLAQPALGPFFPQGGSRHSGSYAPGTQAPVPLRDYTVSTFGFRDYTKGGPDLARIGDELPPSYTYKVEHVGGDTSHQPPALDGSGVPASAWYRIQPHYVATSEFAPVEHDRLDQFVAEHGNTLLELEALLSYIGFGHVKPFNDCMIHVWRACPSVIRNRARLLAVAAAAYQSIYQIMNRETQELEATWNSPGAGSMVMDVGTAGVFYGYARNTLKYMGLDGSSPASLNKEITFMSEEGVKAAGALQGLRNEYAKIGYARIGGLIDVIFKYYSESASSIKSKWTKPEEGLVAYAKTLIGAMLDVKKQNFALDMAGVEAEEKIRKEGVNMNPYAHGVVPFPASEVSSDAWRHGSGWAPKTTRPV